MAQVTHFFAGANGGSGFANLFSEIADPETIRDFIILKGGPGSGKNTFMRSLGKSMEAAGLDVEYLWCSGDPDSLDGVVVPAIGCAAADGTAPHVLEPRYPAAADRYVNLGQFYDVTAAKADAAEIRSLTCCCSTAYRKAYAALRAAGQVEREAVSEVIYDRVRAEKRFRGIVKRELGRRGTEEGTTARRFLGSLTYQGYVWRFDSVDTLCPRVYELRDSFGFAPPLLEELRLAASDRGWNTIACVSPEDTDRMEHLLIPGLGLAFVTSRPGMEYGRYVEETGSRRRPERRIRLDAMADIREKGRFRFSMRMARLLREEAVSRLQEAKANHDALEAVYNPYVDFDGVRALAALESGRWMSWI